MMRPALNRYWMLALLIAIALAEKPGITVHLVDSNKKKAAFLREAQRVTGAPAHVTV